MVSITLSVPEEVKEKMKKYDEINWSAFIRKCILEKTNNLSSKEHLLSKLNAEKEIDEWLVNLSKKARKDRFQELKMKGLL